MPTPDKFFAAQISASTFQVDSFYLFASIGGIVGMLALTLLDAGMVQRKHLTDSLVQKLVCIYAGGTAFLICGYGIWNWQFDQAFGVPNAFRQSVSDWWIGGPFLRHFAQNIDPAILPGADAQQIFIVFFFTYAGLIGAFIHSIGMERMKALPAFILSATAGGVLMPFLTYLTWGPVGPLTNGGLHDFVGAYSLYMFVGTWSLIISWRLGRRQTGSASMNPLLVASGAMLLLVAIPLFVVGCGLLVPGQGYFGITNTNSGLGLLFINIIASFGGGSLSAACIAYRTKKPSYAFFGPIAGYIGCTALFDIAVPWQCLLIGLASPFVMLLTERLVAAMGIDDPKIAPLALGPAIFSALMAGIIGKGVPTGGLPGLTGAYGFQHAHISLGMQVVGIVVTIGFSAATALILVFLLERTSGLRVSSAAECDGLDVTSWQIPADAAP